MWNTFFIVVNETKASNNFKKYKKVKHSLNEHGWDQRIVDPFINSYWCDRYVVRQDARDLGYKQEIKELYDQNGNSWLQIFPRRKNLS